ncbi:MAG: hypothetical protein H6Q58_1424 [Firmicutes bacterium]|nr:hypothetical protein [Bacillota bacterium]
MVFKADIEGKDGKAGDEELVIDTLISQGGTYGDELMKNVKVSFPPNSDKIIINGEPFFLNVKRIDYDGYDEKDSVYKISTYDFNFWVSREKTYKSLKGILENRHSEYLEQEKIQNQSIREEYLKPFEYDTIDDDIYNCFIAYKSSYIESDIGNSYDFTKTEERLAEICKEHGGKYYKNAAKSAKFAIIFSYTNRTASCVNSLREKGYKVTSFENVIEHFGLQDIFDTRGLIGKVERHKGGMTEEE